MICLNMGQKDQFENFRKFRFDCSGGDRNEGCDMNVLKKNKFINLLKISRDDI